MGSDSAGNRYYENRIDYTFGQHRWVEPGDIHNFDSSSIPPEWQGWMTSQHDEPPCNEQSLIDRKTEVVDQMCTSHAPTKSNVGYQEQVFNFHHLHNQSQVRSRGYGIGNNVVGLPPGVKDSYYTQPGSPYNEFSIRKLEFIGSLDGGDGKGRLYKSEKWAERLRTEEEKKAREEEKKSQLDNMFSGLALGVSGNKKRGGTAVGV